MTAPLVVTGRTSKPLLDKLNPIWWFGNDSEQTVDQAPWYHGPDTTVPGYMGPPWPEWQRTLYWNVFRNPLQNFRAYVLGVQDQNYTVHVLAGNPDPNVVQRNDVNEFGWQVSVLKFNNGVHLPWVSYSGNKVVLAAGWQPSGFFGLKLNLHT